MKIFVVCLSLLVSGVSFANSSDVKLMKVILSSGAATGACAGTFCVAKLSDVQCGVYEASGSENACSAGRKVFAEGNSVKGIMGSIIAAGGKLNSDSEGDGQFLFAKSVTCTTEGKPGDEICWVD